MSDFFEIGGWVLLSSVKYIIAILTLLVKSPRLWFWDMLIVSAGGCLGVVVFTFLGSVISKYFGQFDFFKIKFKNLRRFVFIKNGYGLIGIAFLSPLLFGIPLGSIISTMFEPNKNKVLRLQLSSVILWSIFLFGTKGLIQFLN
ncbi:MAG: hypothetical protein ACKVQB_00855 [Bacteroidia bacterium]